MKNKIKIFFLAGLVAISSNQIKAVNFNFEHAQSLVGAALIGLGIKNNNMGIGLMGAGLTVPTSIAFIKYQSRLRKAEALNFGLPLSKDQKDKLWDSVCEDDDEIAVGTLGLLYLFTFAYVGIACAKKGIDLYRAHKNTVIS